MCKRWDRCCEVQDRLKILGLPGPCYIGVDAGQGPVAQLGARLHGMEEVEGSNPSRSTRVPNRIGGSQNRLCSPTLPR